MPGVLWKLILKVLTSSLTRFPSTVTTAEGGLPSQQVSKRLRQCFQRKLIWGNQEVLSTPATLNAQQ